MKKLVSLCLASLIAVAPFQASAQAAAQAISDAPIACKAGQRQINEEGFVKIGGIEQWVEIKGDDCGNPVILMVHGGPGNPNTVYAQSPYAAWEKDFTIVQWDQRGAGRTFTRNPATAEGKLSIAGLANDGNEVAVFTARHLKAKKLILFGGSWGSALSVHMAKARPELYAAYLGTGQLVNGRENETDSYRKLFALAKAAGDAKTIAALETLGVPPWVNPRSPGQFRKISRGYEAKVTTPAPRAWMALTPAYETAKMQAEYEAGEDYSWIEYVGMKGDGIHATLDLYKLGLDFKIPVFMVVGEHDLTTTPDVAKRYFDSISAPKKEYFLLPLTGHDPNPPMVQAQFDILKTRIAPLLK
jgi:pimeloyl-ACP methyl ester carboxylesterase